MTTSHTVRLATIASVVVLTSALIIAGLATADATGNDRPPAPATDLTGPELRDQVSLFSGPDESDDLPAFVVSDLEQPSSGLQYELDHAQAIAQGADYGFYVTTTTDGRLCMIGHTPRNEYPDSEDRDQSATTCRTLAEFEQYGLALLLGPSQEQRGALLLPDAVVSVTVDDMSFDGRTFEIAPFDARLLGNIDGSEVIATYSDGSERAMFGLPDNMELVAR